MTIVLTGGSGFIGTLLGKKLLQRGYTVIVIDRVAPPFTHENLYFIGCDIATQQLPYNVLDHADAVINLAGVSIAQKWTPEVKKAILESRVKSTQHVVESILSATSRPKVFICASAVGFYGDTGNTAVNEQGGKGTTFLSTVVEQWETAARPVADHGVRLVYIRTAPVLGNGGFLAPIRRLMQFGITPSLKGKNGWFSWIHYEDIVNIYLFALETSTLQGVVNAVAPGSVPRKTFDKKLAHYFGNKLLITVPQWITTMMFGEELYAELVQSTYVIPERLLDKGFIFSYPTIEQALHQLASESKKHS